MKIARVISGFLVFAAIMFSWLFTFSLYDRFCIFHNRNQYHPATFDVVDAVYLPSQGDDSESYWLRGTVENHPERFIPTFSDRFSPKNAGDLLAVYPPGSHIPVLYNSQETTIIIQGETLRVLHFTSDFWREEERYRHKLMIFVFLPVPLALLVFLTIRGIHLRRLSEDNQSEG